MNAVVGILGKKALGRLKDKNIQTNSEVTSRSRPMAIRYSS